MKHDPGEEISRLFETLSDPKYNAMRLHLLVDDQRREQQSLRPLMEMAEGESAKLGTDTRRGSEARTHD